MRRCLPTGLAVRDCALALDKFERAAPFPWPPLKQPDPSVRDSDFLGLRVINSCRPSFGSVIDAYVVAPTHRSAHGDRYRSHSVPRTRAATRRAGASACTARASRRDGCGPLAVSRPRRLGNGLAARRDADVRVSSRLAWVGRDAARSSRSRSSSTSPATFIVLAASARISVGSVNWGMVMARRPVGRRPRRAARRCSAPSRGRVPAAGL